MNKRTKRLRKVVALAAVEEQQECIGMKKVQRALDQAVGRLDELTAYQKKYESEPLPEGSIGAARWHDYQRFLARLNQAVAQQQQQVNNSEQTLEAHRRRWQQKRKRSGMLEQIMERYRKAEVSRDEQRMQKALDDIQPMEKLFDT